MRSQSENGDIPGRAILQLTAQTATEACFDVSDTAAGSLFVIAHCSGGQRIIISTRLWEVNQVFGGNSRVYLICQRALKNKAQKSGVVLRVVVEKTLDLVWLPLIP